MIEREATLKGLYNALRDIYVVNYSKRLNIQLKITFCFKFKYKNLINGSLDYLSSLCTV